MQDKFSNIVLNQVIMDSMSGLVYIYSKEGQLVAWNKRGEEILEYSAEELNGKMASNFSQPADVEKVRLALKECFTSGFASVEHVIITKSGKKIPVLSKARSCTIEGEDYLIGLAIDISDLVSERNKNIEHTNEISRLNELLEAENVYLKDQLKVNAQQFEMVGESESLKYVLHRIKQVASTDVSVFIYGETGTGKELVARAIHKNSKRSNKPFIKVNCASIPENLIESELFGHEKGAFTSAVAKQTGRFEIADGGTIFLDEIGELPLNVQPKLLHVLQQGEFERIGSSKTIKTDVRVIAATNKVIENEIKKGQFRSDLYYRLNVFPISIAPLRERKSDIGLLVEYYIRIYSEKFNKPIKAISKKSMQALINYSWPGNVRELENVIERAIITSHNKLLNIECLPKSEDLSDGIISLEENEINLIKKVLEKTYWKINGKGGAAELLKINPATLRSKMRKLGISRKLG
jgi:chemotaxis protein methyltransferase CheR